MVGNSVTRTPAVACDRAELKTGIVHFGVGGFHRSHQQVRAATENEKNVFSFSRQFFSFFLDGPRDVGRARAAASFALDERAASFALMLRDSF